MNKDTLRNLFTTSLYLDVIQLEVRRSERLEHMEKVDYKLSPQSQMLLELFSPETQKRLARDFYFDDIKINEKLLKDEIEDPTYIYFDNKGVGLYLELWVCVNIPCPGCGDKLYKYANPNMPVVDVKCINPSHDNHMGPIYYQIKATEQGTEYAGFKYFSYDEEYICVGSINYGYNCHVIKATNLEDRDLLVGYICIEYKYHDFNSIIIDMNKSFVLIPNLDFNPHPSQMDWNYYDYILTRPISVIKFNNNMIKKFRFSDLYKPLSIIKLNHYYDVVKVYNEQPPPLDLNMDVQLKYLIMKTKYLNLKKQINK